VRNSEVHVDQVYTAKVGDRVVPVRVLSRFTYTVLTATKKVRLRMYYECRNLRTQRYITIKSPQRFREHVPAEQVQARLEVLR